MLIKKPQLVFRMARKRKHAAPSSSKTKLSDPSKRAAVATAAIAISNSKKNQRLAIENCSLVILEIYIGEQWDCMWHVGAYGCSSTVRAMECKQNISAESNLLGVPFTKDVCLSAKAVNALNAGPPQYLADDVCKWHDCFLTR